MKLVTIEHSGRPTAAVVREDGDVAVIADGAYGHVGEVFADAAGLDAARAALTDTSAAVVAYDVDALLAPVLGAPAVLCVGLNYRSHIEEMGRPLPESPTWFSKLPRALTTPAAAIPLPAASSELDYEGEFCVVVGTAGRDIPADRAWEHVGGLTVLNDVTLRDYQWRTKQWFAGKSWEASTPFGPAIVTPDEVGDIGGLELRTSVNGEQRQLARLDDLLFDVPALIADASRIFTLQPGDLIATGTPGGVGAASDPKRFLKDGDVVEVSIDGLGALSNRVAAQVPAGAVA